LWIENQLKKQVAGDYFMITFTLPALPLIAVKEIRLKLINDRGK
jgi:hypothetical protein